MAEGVESGAGKDVTEHREAVAIAAQRFEELSKRLLKFQTPWTHTPR
jgi:hypothetical protein